MCRLENLWSSVAGSNDGEVNRYAAWMMIGMGRVY